MSVWPANLIQQPCVQPHTGLFGGDEKHFISILAGLLLGPSVSVSVCASTPLLPTPEPEFLIARRAVCSVFVVHLPGPGMDVSLKQESFLGDVWVILSLGE